MAIIPEFNAPLANQVVRPNETGESAVQRAAVMGERRASVAGDLIARAGQEKGQAIAGLGKLAEQGINDYGEHEFLMDASDQGPKLANATVAWQNSLNDASQKLDPKDPQAFQAFHDQQMETLRNQFMQGVRTTKGQARADELFNQFSAHAQNQTTAAYAEIAGAKTHADAVNTIHTLSQAVGSNLSGLQNAHDQWDHQMAVYKNAPGVDAHQIASLTNLTEEGHKEIDTSALKAAVEAPNANLDAIQKMTDANGFKYVDKGTIDGYIKQARRANDMEARIARSEARENLRDEQERNSTSLFVSLTDSTTGALQADSVKKIFNAARNNQISGTQASMLIRSIHEDHEALNSETKLNKLDPSTLTTLNSGVGLLPTDPKYVSSTQVLQAKLDGKIDSEQANDLLRIQTASQSDPTVSEGLTKLSKNPIIAAGFDQATQRLIGLSGQGQVNNIAGGGVNPVIKFKSDQFKQDTLRILQNAVIQHQDLGPLINDPTSKTYLFSPERMDQYKPTQQELSTQLVTSAAAAAAAKAAQEGKPKEDLGSILSKALNFAPKPAEQKPVDRRPEG